MTSQLWTLEDIFNLPASTEAVLLTTVKEERFAILVDIDGRWKRVFKLSSTREIPQSYVELDIKGITRDIAAYLAKNMKLTDLLQDKLLHEPIENILSLAERVKNGGAVKSHRGCYYLQVKGKQGKPMELDL